MGSKVSVRDNMKGALKKAKAGAAGAYSDYDDRMTLMDMIRTVKKPRQRNKNPALSVAKEEEPKVEVAGDISSGSDEDVGKGCQQYKRKRKCKDLYDILKLEPPVSCSKLDRQDDNRSQQHRKAKKPVKFSNEKGHNVERDGRVKVVTESLPSIVPHSKYIHRNLEHRGGSLIGQTDSMIETLETLISFSDSLGLCNQVAVTHDSTLGCFNAQESGGGKLQKSQAAAALRRPRPPQLKASRNARSPSQSQLFQTLDSEADLLPVSGARLHTCADAKNCQNACVAKAVAPNLDHMSEEELIYWYGEVTQKKFTHRSGEKVRGRIRRVIRAEVKRASALNSNNTSSASEGVGRSNSSSGTPSPAQLIVDLHSTDSPACEFSVPIVAKDIPCAFNSAVSFDDYVDEGIARTSINCCQVSSGTIPLRASLAGEVDFTQKCKPLESSLAKHEPLSVVGSMEVKHGSEAFCKLETERVGALEKRILTGDRCADIVYGSQSESHEEGHSLLPSAESSLSDTDSLGIEAYHSLKEMRESGAFGLNAAGEEESTDSFKGLTERVLNLGAAELSQSNVGNEDSTSPIIRKECEIGEARPLSSYEEKSRKMELGCPFFSISGEHVLSIPDFQPSSRSRDFQYCVPLKACDTETSTGQEDPDNATQTNPLDSLEAAEEEHDDHIMSIEGTSDLAVPVTDHDKKRKGSVGEDSNQSECQAMIGEILADGLAISQRTAPVSPDLQEEINEPAGEVPTDLESSRPVDVCSTSLSAEQSTPVSRDFRERSDEPTEGILMETSQQVHGCSTSEAQQSAERFDHRVLVDTSDHSTRDDGSIQGESQLSGVCLEGQNRVGTPTEICTTPLHEDESQQLVSTNGVSNTSRSISLHDELVNDIDESQLSGVCLGQNRVGTLTEIFTMPLHEDEAQQLGSSNGVSNTSRSISHHDELVNDIDESQPSGVCLEGQNRVGMLTEICTTSLHEDESQQLGSTNGVSNTSRSISQHKESVNDIDISAEICCTDEQVKGVDGEGLLSSPMLSEVPGEELEVCDTESVPSLQTPLGGSDTDDCVLSLEEYIAVHRAEDSASCQEPMGDIITQDFEQDLSSQEMKMVSVSREGREESSEDGLGDEFDAQQTVKDVACSQKCAVENDHFGAISDPKGVDLEEDVAPKMMDVVASQQVPARSTRHKFYEGISFLQLAEDITSQLLQGEVVSQVEAENGVGKEAEAGVATHEFENDASHGLEEEDRTSQPKGKEVLSSHNPEEGAPFDLDDEEAVPVEDLEEDVLIMATRANQNDGGDVLVEDVAGRDPEEDVGRKAMDEVVSQNIDADGTTNEADEFLATREIREVGISEQLPRKDSQKNLSALHVEEEGATQVMQEGSAPELKDESSSQHLDDYVIQGKYVFLRSSEPDAKNVSLNREAGVGGPHLEEDIAARQTEDAALQSPGEDAALDQSSDLSCSSLSITGPTERPEDVVSLQDSDGAATVHKLEEHDADDFVSSQRVRNVVEEIYDDSTVSKDHGNDLAKANNLCEKAGDDALDYPVILSQSRRFKTQEECMSGIEETTQVTTSLSRRVTRASLKLEKSIRAVEEELSQNAELVLPDCLYNCPSLRDPPVSERNTIAPLASPLDSLPPKGSLPPLSDAELEQIDNFKYPMLQEEWQDAGKCLDQIEMSFFEDYVAVSSPKKRKFCDSESDSNQVKRIAGEGSPQEKALFRNFFENISPERVSGGSPIMEDDHVPTALSKAVIERNGERSGAVDSSQYLADRERPVKGQDLNAIDNPDRVIAREKQKVQSLKSMNCYNPDTSSRCLAESYDPLLGGEPAQSDSPEPTLKSNCDPSTTGESNSCIDLLSCEKLGEEGSSQDFEPPSKLPCRRKTISPLSQLELMRASSSNSPPSKELSPQKIPTFRFKLPGGLASHRGGSTLLDREPLIPGCSYLEPNTKAGKYEASDGTAVSLDSSEDDTEYSCGRQEHGSKDVGGEPVRKFSLALSPTSSSPDSSQNTSSQEPRESQSISAPASKGILKTGLQSCKGLCKCAACSTSRAKAGTASDFIASQMKTFQLIAGRLTKEMQGLRTLVEINLSSPEKTSEIQETLKKSRDVEEAADKNIATLLRDCKRYCKLTATKPVPMRKIAFADEAGKKLCHVKTFQSKSLPRSILDLL